MILGVVLMVIVSLMDYSWLLNFYWIIYFLTLSCCWQCAWPAIIPAVPPGGLIWALSVFSPRSFSKILLIMFFARYLMAHEEDLNTLKTILTSVGLVAVPLALIAIQPDLKKHHNGGCGILRADVHRGTQL